MTSSLFTPKKLEKYKQKLRRRAASKKKKYQTSSRFDTQELSKELFGGTYKCGSFEIEKIPKLTFQCQSLKDDVVMHSLNKVLCGVYRVKQSDRSLLVKQVIDLLNENHEKYVYRLDIKSFYESISLFKGFEKVVNDGLISAEYEHAVWSIYNSIKCQLPRNNGVKGLPRGLSISSTLSEVYMRNFDSSVRRIDGVYFYARYVDDIIIISTKEINIKKQICSNLPNDLNLNPQKQSWFEVKPGHCKRACNCPRYSLDFLGYNLNFSQFSCKNSEQVKISLSENKFNRFKIRLHESFAYYRASGKPKWLLRRVAFLTSNFLVDESKKDKFDLYSGVYFNYNRINDLSCLRELDELLHFHITTPKTYGRFSIDKKLAHQLKNYSFVKGFVNRRVEYFHPSHINTIKGIWSE